MYLAIFLPAEIRLVVIQLHWMQLHFYKSELVKQAILATSVIFEVCNKTPIQRKSCKMHPNPTVADIEDFFCY